MQYRPWMKAALAALFATSLTTCLDPTDGRAEKDLTIGQANVGGVRFSVDGGLAAVRIAEPGRLVLWGGAPGLTLRAEVASDATASWEIELQNALADVGVETTATTGTVALERLEGGLPTRPRFRVVLPQGTSATLRFAPADEESNERFRFAVLSDVQTAIDEVQDLFSAIDAYPGVRFVLGAGDLTQNGSREECERFQKELEHLSIPYFATLGNHELVSSTVYFQDYFGRANFHFDYRGVHFSMIDSGSATIDPMVYDWLDGWLAEGAGGVHAVFMHIPPIDPIGVRNGSFASRNEAAKLMSKLVHGGVDLTIYGHIHSYYAFDNAGIPAFISGGGGALPERFDEVGRHFMVIDIGAQEGLIETTLVQIEGDFG